MPLTVILWSLLYTELKRMTMARIMSELIRNFWNKWELRVMLLLSMSFQLLLVKNGDRINHPGRHRFVWFIYLLADWAATVVLSTLLRGPAGVDKSLVLVWTPFLLWHLGSPFNITAYSLDDNEIWRRHFFGMLAQSASALYIFVRFWTYSKLAYMAVPVLVAGLFKYVERIWALRSASEKQLTTSLYTAKETDVIEPAMIRTGWMVHRKRFAEINADNEQGISFRSPHTDKLRLAYFSYKIFKPLFSDLGFQVAKDSFAAINICSKSPDDAFELVEIELQFLYDVLYTKVPFQQSGLFIALNSFCFFSTVSALIVFSVFVGKLQYQRVDAAVTCLLIGGAIVLDLYSAFLLSVSEWTMVRWIKPKNWIQKLYCRFVVPKVGNKIQSGRAKGGSKLMAQHDLINYFIKKQRENTFTKALRIFDKDNLLQKFCYTKWQDVTPELKSFIFLNLRDKHKNSSDKQGTSRESLLVDILDPLKDMSFIKRVFIWHIATNLLYYRDQDKYGSGALGRYCKISKRLSNYMMYLVLSRPTMLPRGFSDVINRETCNEAERLFPCGKSSSFKRTRTEFIASLLSLVRVSNAPVFFSGKKMSALFDGCWLANQLIEMVSGTKEMGQRYDQEEKWEMVSQVWMDLMTEAAKHCAWKEHSKELIHGGELLSFVSLLIAHLGLNKQIVITNLDSGEVMKSRF